MTTKFFSLALCAVLFGSGALAQDTETEMELAINDGNGDDVVIRINSRDDGFNLQDMQLGESRSINTVDGKPALVTRVADGYQFDVDGRKISMPLMEHEGTGEHHKNVHIVRHIKNGPAGHADGVTIISPTPLDDATRTSIESALSAAGLNEVRFIDIDTTGSEPHGMAPRLGEGQEVIIRKKLHVTN